MTAAVAMPSCMAWHAVDVIRYRYQISAAAQLLLLSYALGAITGQPGNGIIVCRV